MRACKSFARWSGDFEDRVRDLSDDVRALICQDVGCQTCRDICEERKQCLSFHVRWFSPFDLPDLIAAKPRSSFSGETSSTLASMNTTIHSSHITRWRFQACDRKVRPLGDIIIRAQRLSIKIQLLISIFSSATRATVWRSLIWNATERATKLSSTSIASTTFSYRWSFDIFLSLKWPWALSSASEICGIWLRDDSSHLELSI